MKFLYDNVHPNSHGHLDISNAILEMLLQDNTIKTTMTVYPIKTVKGNYVDLSATLKDSSNVPLANKLVNFSINGSVVGKCLN